ncbi:non-structural maintenance of chromosomes element 3 homolog [Odontomachus brunneus]|uniref:non-structural maintenance of chromosomes element 3 homolog n=1 Tax=Odontomachus brunneus TaxID=486640 RepID=UPI0013F26550|nr:non-structural maintenance of chromosomes element 3 homolog [Odontomachus brunneus]
MSKEYRTRSKKIQRVTENFSGISLSQPSTSSHASQLLELDERPISRRSQRSQSQRSQLQKSQSQIMQKQENMQTVSGVIKYLFMAGRNKQPISRAHIFKNTLLNPKDYQLIMAEVEAQLSKVFGYKLLIVEGNKYIMVNEISNELPHLNSKKSSSTQTLLFLVLVHIFMLGESCKEDLLWDFLCNLGIITRDDYTHEYFGDVKQLVTVDFVNQRYLEKIIIDKDDPTKLEYKWGSRALHEITFRSALEFVANVYGASSLNKWKLQYKIVKEQECKN